MRNWMLQMFEIMICNQIKPDANISLIKVLAARGMIEEAHRLSSKLVMWGLLRGVKVESTCKFLPLQTPSSTLSGLSSLCGFMEIFLAKVRAFTHPP